MTRSLTLGLRALGGAAAICFAAPAHAQITQPITNFSNDVETAIDWGIAWLEANAFLNAAGNVCGTFSAAGDGAGLAALAVLEKRRADPSQNALSQGWQFANAVDQGRIASVMAFIISRPLGLPSANYRDGADMMALSVYQRTGGPDQAGALTALADRVDRVLANQSPSGYWDYALPNPRLDSSATQLVIAGLSGARAVYQDPATSDPARLAAINAALQLAGDAYATNGGAGTVTPTERAHGYAIWAPGAIVPGSFGASLQQTSSGLWAMLAGGRTVNDPEPQAYVEWLRNHYRFTDVFQNGQFFTGSIHYYMWSATKAFRLIELQNNALPGVMTPDDIGALVADPAAPAYRQARLDPGLVSRPASFANAANYTTFAPINPGVGGAGYYLDPDEPGRWYFDFAFTLLSQQDLNAGLPTTFGRFWGGQLWDPCADQAWAILVLERALGGICTDLDQDGICDEEDNCVQAPNPDQTDANGNGIGDVCEMCCELPGETPAASSIDVCEQSGGVPVAEVLCQNVVCCAGAAGVVEPYLTPAGECSQAGGQPIDEAICCDEALCCRLPDGTAIDTNHADCVARQGVPVPDEVCAEPLCCHLPDGTYEVVPASECAESNGALARRRAFIAQGPIFANLCEEICCQLPGGSGQTLVAGVCRDQGGAPAGDPALCEAPICCGTPDGAVSLTADACVEAQGVVLGADLCLEICCRGIGPEPAPATLWACQQGGGIVVPSETCEPTVCCGLPDGAPQYLSENDCSDQQGVVLAADRCESACCVTHGQPSITSVAACTAGGGAIDASGAACAAEVCCALPNGQASTLPFTECTAAGGTITAAEKCVDEEVCCALPDGTAATLAASACAAAMGQPTAAEKCADEEVCCALPDGSAATLAASACAAAMGQPTAAEKCDAPGCCKLPDGTTDDLSPDECKGANGSYIPDVECVPDVCCKRKDGSLAFVDPALCTGTGQAVVSDELCEVKICCRVDGHVEWLAADVCDEQSGQNVEPAACSDVICCEIETGVFDEIPAGECGDRPVAHPKRCNVPVEIDGGLVDAEKDAGSGTGNGNGNGNGGGCAVSAPVSGEGGARFLALAAIGLAAIRRRRRR
jgi:hypothetical protein